MRKQTDYPVGAKWTAELSNGVSGMVWLYQRFPEGLEVWRFSCAHRDGSGAESDWSNNKQDCVSACATSMRALNGYKRGIEIRFKRVKE